MSLFNRKNSIDASHIEVELKNWGRFNPSQYIKAIALVLALALLFALTVLPGLLRYGSVVSFNSVPSGVAVYANSQRLGATPFKTFLKADNYIISYQKPYYSQQEQPLTVKGRRFLSLFLPLTLKAEQELVLENLDGLLQENFYEYSKWVLIPARSAFPRPPLLSSLATDLVSQWQERTNNEKTLILRWAEDIFAMTSDDLSLNEIEKTWSILRNVGLPIDLSYVTGIDFNNRSVTFDELLQELTPNRLQDGNIVLNKEPKLSPLTVRGQSFTYAVGGSFVMGNSEEFTYRAEYEYYPHNITLNGFYYSPTLVTEAQMAAMLARRPNADDNAPYRRSAFDSQSAKYITHQQARMYARDLNAELARLGLDKWQARLITEAEWEYLARQNLLTIDGYEWTEDQYYLYRYALYPQNNRLYSPFRAALYTVRGYDNHFDIQMKINERGSALGREASPYLGFRVVLVPRR